MLGPVFVHSWVHGFPMLDVFVQAKFFGHFDEVSKSIEFFAHGSLRTSVIPVEWLPKFSVEFFEEFFVAWFTVHIPRKFYWPYEVHPNFWWIPSRTEVIGEAVSFIFERNHVLPRKNITVTPFPLVDCPSTNGSVSPWIPKVKTHEVVNRRLCVWVLFKTFADVSVVHEVKCPEVVVSLYSSLIWSVEIRDLIIEDIVKVSEFVVESFCGIRKKFFAIVESDRVFVVLCVSKSFAFACLDIDSESINLTTRIISCELNAIAKRSCWTKCNAHAIIHDFAHFSFFPTRLS